VSGIGRFLKNVFFWTYDRGSWQWDLSCLFFILVIFTTPQDFLLNYSRFPLTPEEIRGILIDWIRSLL
jgi:hypothetical protein